MGKLPDGLEGEVSDALRRLEERAGNRLGDPQNPLLVSVRSGARESMPGMLDTVLNLGLNDQSVEGLTRATSNERFAWDSYRRLVQMYGTVAVGIPSKRFEDLLDAARAAASVTIDSDLGAEQLRELVGRFKDLYDFPQDPHEQLDGAIRAVFEPWGGNRAVAYRGIHRIPDDWGTAMNIQQMVFGNEGASSASGVAYSRDVVTGADEPSGDFLVNAQGEDVASGARTPLDISELATLMPEVHEQLVRVLRTLEAHYGDMQDTEFTVEAGRLYILQTRSAKRPAQGAVRFAVDAVNESLLNRQQALATINASALEALLPPHIRPGLRLHRRNQGRGRFPGGSFGRSGTDRLGSDIRWRRGKGHDSGPSLHRGRRRSWLPCRPGDPHERGGQGPARGPSCPARRRCEHD